MRSRVKKQPVIDGVLQFIGNNQEKFKKAFHQVSRSKSAIKYWWGETPNTADKSAYVMWMDKYKTNAKEMINLVQDDELMYNIRFKVKNFRSNGEYPELTIPAAVQ